VAGAVGVVGFGELGELTEGEVPVPGADVDEPGDAGVPIPVAPPVGLAGAPAAPAPPAACAIARPDVEIKMANEKADILFITKRRSKLD
jgi:hypothetical protein